MSKCFVSSIFLLWIHSVPSLNVFTRLYYKINKNDQKKNEGEKNAEQKQKHKHKYYMADEVHKLWEQNFDFSSLRTNPLQGPW